MPGRRLFNRPSRHSLEMNLLASNKCGALGAFSGNGPNGSDPLAASLAQGAVPHELPTLFIPKPEGERLQAAQQGNRFHRLEKRLGLVAFFEVVVRNARAQMMNVMKPNVAGEPL